MHGAHYVVWAGFDRSAFELSQGELVAFRSSPNVIRQFCPRCGATLTYEKDVRDDPALDEAASVVYIAVATLDDPGAYPPDEVVHVRERIIWLDLGDNIPQHELVSPEAGHLQFGGIDGDE